jgi:hypothetical protein
MRRLTDILPYEPGYSVHREVERRRRETRTWLRQRESMLEQPMRPSWPTVAGARQA